MNKLGEIWKANKKGYLISGIIITLGCLLFYAKNKAPLEYTISLGWLGLGFFMFAYGLLFGGND